MRLSVPPVGLEGKCCHQGNALEEEDDVTLEEAWKGLMKVELVVGPLELPDHPQGATQGEQHPKRVSSPVRGTGIQEQPGVGQERHDTLHNVSKRGKRRRAAVKRQRHGRIDDQDEQPNSQHPGDSAGGRHNLAISSLGAQGGLREGNHSRLAQS